jgi:hypothetical protein
VLGSDADDDGAPVVVAQRGPLGQDRGRHGQRLLAQVHGHAAARAVARHGRLQQVHRRRPDERGHEQVGRLAVEHLRRGDLLEPPVPHDRHPVAHRHGLDLVVGDVDGRGLEVALELGDLGPHLHPQLGVEVRQRLVHEEHGGIPHDRPPHRHPLALAAGQLRRPAVHPVLELQGAGRLADPLLDLGLGQLGQLEREADVLLDGHVGVERVVLEHHRDVPLLGRQVVDDPVADAQLAGRDALEPGDHAQGGRLAAPRRAHQHEELAVLDHEVQVRDADDPVGVHLRQLLHGHRSHVASPYPLTEPASSPRTK